MDDLTGKSLKEGQVMYDFTIANVKGEEITLSEVLKKKKVVMLNFWFVNCEWCVKEFPAMSSAYNAKKDMVEIIAFNPFDNKSGIDAFLEKTPLPFEVASCPFEYASSFGIQSYPVSIFIDRYGVIRKIENGAMTYERQFTGLFDFYAN